MLYSYCILVDDGAAPNPFWGVCTLAICKPVIRRNAKIGDWIVGTGSARYGFQNKMVYAMLVDDIMSYKEYDDHCKKNLREKIPDWNSTDLKRRVGDCIYDFSSGKPELRDSVHEGQDIIDRDFRGKNVLLSKQFVYFGSTPHPIKDSLIPIVRQGQGHKSKSNDPFLNEFINWIGNLLQNENIANYLPYGFNDWKDENCAVRCTERHIQEDDEDERIGNC
jgi:hypothetical protein